ncbi:MAG: DUF58 domain-containing protein [Caldilineaceae bacterium]|nr:DUF58 domain-containing protein [Caldilineaceae bacterium]
MQSTRADKSPSNPTPLFSAWRGRQRPRRYIDTTKDTQFSDAWVILGVILSVIGVVGNNPFFTAAGVALWIFAGIGWLWNSLSLAGLYYERSFSEVRAFQGETVDLTLRVRNQKLLPLTWLNIRDTFPPELPISDTRHEQKTMIVNPATNLAEFHSFWMPGAFQQVARTYTIECSERGFHDFGPAQINTGDGFGFFDCKAQLPTKQRLIVYPKLYSVAELQLPSKNPFGEARAEQSLFEDPLRTVGIREWQSWDSQRRVHWKATARHQQLLSRVYEPSEELQVLLFLNVATMERHWHGYLPELQERTISVAGSLAALAAEQRLPVGLIANGALPGGDQPIRQLPGRNPNQLIRLLELLAAVTPFATAPIEALLLEEAPRLPWGATLVVVTAIAHAELLATLLDLADAGRRVVLFTLAEEPPKRYLPNVRIYHLPHLIDDLVAPVVV